ncbi:DMT family transporter [Paenibacillus sp. UNC499MF]|uniref:DMT family transporter n=1 Tax=Paenibacillus sp. UNC499MF TaxID=1502751 RepID=UPI0008A081AE|nr:DMT family transporter [Paenibacillus sp. UNC499MF]SEG73075.1 Permease of the drug/metabolite transporter (DMT) superfamily [Paenibacillus sp. UNC499MF]
MKTAPLAKAYLSAVLYALIIGLSFIFVKTALVSTGPFDLLAHRFTVSLAALLVFLAISGKRLNIRKRDYLAILPMAVLYPVLFFAFQTFGLVQTSAAEAGIIQAAAPVFTMMLASVMLKERTTTRQKLFIALSVAGGVYIFAMKGLDFRTLNGAGLFLILLSALSSAGYSVLARKLSRSYSPLDLTFVSLLFGFIAFNGFAVIRSTAQGTLPHYFEPFGDLTFTVSVVFLGVLSSLASSFLSNYSLSKMEAFKISIFSQLATIVTMAAGVLILHEKLAYFHLIGAALMIAGVVGVCLPASPRKMSGQPAKKSEA